MDAWSATAEENQRIEGVVERYLKGDSHERLNLWLSYRDLRPRLSQLERTMHDSD